MISLSLHPWDISPREAIQIQQDLRSRVSSRHDPSEIRYIAGADIAWDRNGPKDYSGYAGVIVFEFPSLREVERVSAYAHGTFPYVPGLLSFREIPLLIPAFEKLTIEPDVILVDGQGIAHPRRIGIASHLGLIFNKPAIGCAKSRLIGTHREPALPRGSRARLLDEGETIGTVLRTRDGVNPIFVSIGHKMDLKHAISLTLACSDGFRIPKPTRLADHFVAALRRSQET